MELKISQIIDGKSYSTYNARLLASNEFWDGRNWKPRVKGKYLYKTPKGNYFVLHTTQTLEEDDFIEPITPDEAKQVFERLPNHEAIYDAVFDDEPEEA